MKISNYKEQETKGIISITADQDELNDTKNKILKNFQKEAKIQGFRPGKAPIEMVEKNIDQNQLQNDVLREVVEILYGKSLDELKIKPISSPEINIVKFVPFNTLEFIVIVEKLGKVTLPNIKSLKVVKPKIEVSNNEINEAVEDLRLRAADFNETDKAAKLTDRVSINFDGIDPKTKKSIEGTNGTDYPLILGSRSFIPGFEEELIGLKIGDKKSFDIVFPEDYSVDSFKKRKVVFSVVILKVEESNVPALDDKLAIKFGPFKNLDELRSAIKAEMEKELKINNQRKLEDEILNFLGEKTKVELSDKLVDEEVDLVESKAKKEALSQDLTWEEYLKALNMDKKSFAAQARETAIKRVRSGIAIGEIAQRDNIQITNDEFQQSIQYLEEQYKDDAMHEELHRPENQRDLMIRLLTDKVLKHLSTQVN